MNNKTFDDLVIAVSGGLISRTEFLLQMQLPEHAVQNIMTLHKLPAKFTREVEIADLMITDDIEIESMQRPGEENDEDEVPKPKKSSRDRLHKQLVEAFVARMLNIEVFPFMYDKIGFAVCEPSMSLHVTFADPGLMIEARKRFAGLTQVRFLTNSTLLIDNSYATRCGISTAYLEKFDARLLPSEEA